MKKHIALILVLLLCLAALPALAYPSLADIGEYARVSNPNPADRLHLRNGPGSSYASLGKYYNGTVCEILKGTAADKWVKVLGTVADNTWFYVQVGSQIGYMMSKYLQ